MMNKDMNSKGIKLVVADIDLTLIGYMNGLPDLNKKAMEELHRQGLDGSPPGFPIPAILQA